MDWPRVARIADTAVVAALVVSAQLQVWTASGGALAENRAVHGLLLVAVTVPLLVRRSRPLPVLLLVLGATFVQFQLGGETFQPWFAVLFALYALGAHAARSEAAVGVLTTAALVLAGDLPKLEVRAEAAERESAELAARAVADERARIARELHDLVAHSMGVIVIQSQAGQRAVDADPELARTALASIENAGRQGLAEMRRLLGLLTSPDTGSVAPHPGLRELGALLDRVRSAGLRVDLDTGGDLTPLPPGVDLAVYRIVQEALTNVLKHAHASTVRVAVRGGCGGVDLEVCDDGRGPGAIARAGVGRGHIGMRERAALYGGSVETGALPGGGYRVRARLPVEGTTT